jgi:hypothetical protein
MRISEHPPKMQNAESFLRYLTKGCDGTARFELVQIIRPPYRHLHALRPMFASRVAATQIVVFDVSQLALDCISMPDSLSSVEADARKPCDVISS